MRVAGRTGLVACAGLHPKSTIEQDNKNVSGFMLIRLLFKEVSFKGIPFIITCDRQDFFLAVVVNSKWTRDERQTILRNVSAFITKYKRKPHVFILVIQSL